MPTPSTYLVLRLGYESMLTTHGNEHKQDASISGHKFVRYLCASWISSIFSITLMPRTVIVPSRSEVGNFTLGW